MRFIGGKSRLLNEIEQIIQENATSEINIFMDMFAGTTVVAKYFKNKYQILSNDLLYFSYVIQKAVIENPIIPKFRILKNYLQTENILFYLENENVNFHFKNRDDFFITNNYSPVNNCNRMYFTEHNAERIDFIRLTIENWHRKELIDNGEYFYLLACLVESIPFFSNISGTYGAFLKHWDRRSLKRFRLTKIEVFDNNKPNKCYNLDANELIKHVQGDVLYLDPPYNARQYLPNYHLLETVVKYDYPEIKGVTGIRKYKEDEKSKFCQKNNVMEAFEVLIKNAKFKYIVLSYNNEGLMAEEEIEDVLKKYSRNNKVVKKKMHYRKYRGKKNHIHNKQLFELLYFIEK